MFDGTTATFEKAWRFPTVEIIATMGDKIIIEDQEQPGRGKNVTLISGRVDDVNHSLAEAKRELLEETGMVSDDWEQYWHHDSHGKLSWDVYYYIARDAKKIQEPELDSGERITTRSVTFDEFLNLADEPTFWISPLFVIRLMQLRADAKAKETFRRQLFPRG